MHDLQYHHSRILSGPVSVLSDPDPTLTLLVSRWVYRCSHSHPVGDTSIQFHFSREYIPVTCPCDSNYDGAIASVRTRGYDVAIHIFDFGNGIILSMGRGLMPSISQVNSWNMDRIAQTHSLPLWGVHTHHSLKTLSTSQGLSL
jgi:hypothetical protein